MEELFQSEEMRNYLFGGSAVVMLVSYLWVVGLAFGRSFWFGVLTVVLAPFWYLYSLLDITRCWCPLLLNLAGVCGVVYASLLTVRANPEMSAVFADDKGEVTLVGLWNLDGDQVKARLNARVKQKERATTGARVGTESGPRYITNPYSQNSQGSF